MDEVHPLLGEEQGTPLAARQFEAELRAGKPEWIADHRIGGRVLLPATGYLEMALAAGRELWNGAEGAVEDVALPPEQPPSDGDDPVDGRRIRMATGYEMHPWADLRPAGDGQSGPPRKLWHQSPGSAG